jgi:putative ABC transport system permease protein
VFLVGQPLATGFTVRGSLPQHLPSGLVSMSNRAVVESLRRPIRVASSAINLLDFLLWIIAAAIIGTILYMSSLERLRDFAALKAIGARNRQVFVGVAAQAIVLSISAGVVALIASRLLAPLFPIKIEIPAHSYPLTIGVAVGVGLLGSIAGVRKAMAIDPALAFGG